LKSQFPNHSGLQSTLLQNSLTGTVAINGVQILHDRSDHWITFLHNGINQVTVYDSVYSTVEKETKAIIAQMTSSEEPTIQVQTIKQSGGMDCGLYAIAFATSLTHGQNPCMACYQQENMRKHLVQCFETGVLTLFPIE
jgi:Ulp1 family protease